MSPRVQWVCVLGDFGRSPRMQYHTLSLATQMPDDEVYVVAYGGSQPLEALLSTKNVHLSLIPEVPTSFSQLPRILKLACKVLHQLLWLSWLMLFRLPRPATILMQNPPAIPTMLLCWLVCRLRGASLIIDWHNFGYTIMALTHGKSHLLVRLAQAYEKFWGRLGDAHFCVCKAMQRELQQNWDVNATVLYDRPPSFFQRSDVDTAHDLFSRLSKDLTTPGFDDFITPLAKSGYGGQGKTLVTETTGTGAAWRMSRPAIVVSSTSWTPDEDFGVLLEAAMKYNSMVEKDVARAAEQEGTAKTLPNMLLLITDIYHGHIVGKGPQKEMYLERIRKLQLQHVAIRTLWLEAADYPKLLGSADIGVSLHTSSSGLDLPMKVVDMFGAGLPVCAMSYSCIDELVEDGATGLLFSTSEQLADHLATLLRGFPLTPCQLLKKLQEGVRSKEQGLRWEQNWINVAAPHVAHTATLPTSTK